jgi:hypothetical protein
MERKIFIAAFLILFSAISAWAVTDYRSMSTEDLTRLRGTLQNASQEEREAFRTAWREKLQQMAPEDQQKRMGPPANRPANDGTLRQGEGQGMGKGYGKRHGGRMQ